MLWLELLIVLLSSHFVCLESEYGNESKEVFHMHKYIIIENILREIHSGDWGLSSEMNYIFRIFAFPHDDPFSQGDLVTQCLQGT